MNPDPDKPGIAIVGPSGCPADDSPIPLALERLRQQGFAVHNYYQPENKYLRFAASDKERLAQLYAAAENPQVQYIMALRGGYGISRLLPHLDYARLAASGKCWIGHSDFTALQMALYARTGLRSVAGPMLCADFSGSELSNMMLRHFLSALRDAKPTFEFAASGNPIVKTEGRLWGGNLAMLVHLLGTPCFPEIEGGILYLEDIAEHPYRVERMLLQLHFAGVLDKQKAILLGDFSGYQLGVNDNGYNFDSMVDYVRNTVAIPVLTGLPFGHIKDKVSLIFGADSKLISDGHSVRLEMQGWS